MTEKPQRAADYPGHQTQLVKATCLYVATKLGDLMDELVIVGGAQFLGGGPDDEVQADVVGFVAQLLSLTSG
jgi:hypothetical protein